MTTTTLPHGTPRSDPPYQRRGGEQFVCEQPAFDFSTEAGSQSAERSTIDGTDVRGRQKDQFVQRFETWASSEGRCHYYSR